MKKIRLLTATALATTLASAATITSCSLFKKNPTTVTYLVIFDKNCEDSSVKSLTQKVVSGDTVVPAQIQRAGWKIQNWCTDKDGNNPFDFSSKITSTTTLYAKWASESTTLRTVTFHKNDGTGNTFTEKVVDKQTAVPAYITWDGHTFDGWYTEEACVNKFDFTTPITTNKDLYAKWSQIENPVTITFDSQEGSDVPSQIIEKGKTCVEPKSPTKQHNTFDGWYTEPTCENKFDFTQAINADKTLYAKWNPIETKTIKFDTGYGSTIPFQKVYVGDKVTKPSNPTKTKADFVCWCEDAECKNEFNFDTPITADKTLYAKWNTHPTSIEVYSRSGSTQISSLTLYIGDVVNPFKVKSIWTDGTNTETLSDDLKDYTITGGTSIVSYDSNHYITANSTGTANITLTPNDTAGGASAKTISVTVSESYQKYLSFAETTIDGVTGYEVSANTTNNAVLPSTLVIPSTFNSKPVIAVAEKGFEEQTVLQKVYLPYTIIEIKNDAFSECRNIQQVNFPEGLKTIGKSAFGSLNKDGNLQSINLPSTLITIDDGAFRRQASLKSVFIPKSVQYLQTCATDITGCFQQCTSLTSFVIEDGTAIKNLWKYCLAGCSSIQELVIPKGIETISHNAFENCTSLTTITLPTTLTSLGSDIEGSPFPGCKSLTTFKMAENNNFYPYDSATHQWGTIGDYLCKVEGKVADNKCSICFIPYSVTDLALPKEVVKINAGACYEHTNLKTFTVADDNEFSEILFKAFYGCSGLTSINLGNCSSLTSFGDWAFSLCTSLTNNSIVWPTTHNADTTLILGKGSFSGCTGITEIHIPTYVETFGEYAFDIETLTKMYFGNQTYKWKFASEILAETLADDYEAKASAEEGNVSKYTLKKNYSWTRV